MKFDMSNLMRLLLFSEVTNPIHWLGAQLIWQRMLS